MKSVVFTVAVVPVFEVTDKREGGLQLAFQFLVGVDVALSAYRP